MRMRFVFVFIYRCTSGIAPCLCYSRKWNSGIPCRQSIWEFYSRGGIALFFSHFTEFTKQFHIAHLDLCAPLE
jgi:hypothetical protein